MNRPLAAALGAVVAASLASAVPSYADDPLPAATITSPAEAETVGDSVIVTATAPGAPYVRFGLRNFQDWEVARKAPVPPGPDGTFTDTLPTKGLQAAFHLIAQACRTTDVSSCDGSEHWHYVKRAPLPAVTAGDDWRDVIDPSTTGSISVVIPDTTGLDVFLATPKGRLAPGPAGPRSIDISGIGDGYARVAIAQCSDLNPRVCASKGVTSLIRRAPHASFLWNESFISQNRDGIWETAGYQLTLDPDLPVRARWRVLRGTQTVVGPVDYSASDVAAARQLGGIELTADPRAVLGSQLPAGSYQFQVEVIPDNVPGYTKRSRVGFPLRVANAPSDWRLRVDRSVIYPADQTDAGPEVRLLHGLDADEVRYGRFLWRVINADGRMVTEGWYAVGWVNQRIAWNGRTRYGRLLPAGRYRFEVVARDRANERFVRSPYFTVSHRRRVYEQVVKPSTTARSSLVRKSRLRQGRIVRGPLGSLDYVGNLPGHRGPDLRTIHQLTLPATRVTAAIRLVGAWRQTEPPRVFMIDRRGRRHENTLITHMEPGLLQLDIKDWSVRSNDTLRFEVAVQHYGRTRLRGFRIAYSRYRWVN